MYCIMRKMICQPLIISYTSLLFLVVGCLCLHFAAATDWNKQTNKRSWNRHSTFSSIHQRRRTIDQHLCLMRSWTTIILACLSLVLQCSSFFSSFSLSNSVTLSSRVCICSSTHAFQRDLSEASGQSVRWESILHGAFRGTGTPGHCSNGSLQKPPRLRS